MNKTRSEWSSSPPHEHTGSKQVMSPLVLDMTHAAQEQLCLTTYGRSVGCLKESEGKRARARVQEGLRAEVKSKILPVVVVMCKEST